MRYGFAKAYAKLNLTLDVLGLLDDGYHDLEMVMQSVSLHDSVAVRIGCGGDVSCISNISYIPNDERNIAVKAARAFLDATGINCGGIAITVEKRIPSSAGMAGGSADGAAVLRLLNELCDFPLSDEELCAVGLTVGADVPFCLMGGTALACAKGEAMTELRSLPACFFVIAKPARGMSTKAVFAEIDNHPIEKHPDTETMLSAIEKGDISSVAANVYNVFEPVVSADVRDVARIKNVLLDGGALCAAMTGSGSAVFGIFTNREEAERVKRKLGRRYADVFVAEPVSSEKVRGCVLIP
ncbi:MAG: 4-(cytidine 5'-diphospho)-2-C-methyl-D-erythritol kinase [Oscillospiraceae bacterium]|nr:4-(cytidine 5'-diphospho)-2-C-methyl-D-erythritol kinase [Oscillospiraceae bacterium]